MKRIRQQTSALLLPLVVLSVLVLLTWPIWRWLWSEWWSNPYYSHGLLILPVSVYLAWRRWPAQLTKECGDSRGLILTAGGTGLFVLFVGYKAQYLAAFAIIGILAGLAWTFGGLKLQQRLAFPIGFMGLMVPLPLVERVTVPLALWTGAYSGGLVHWWGLDVTIIGAAVTLPNTTLTIGAQCSGINSIISLFTLTTLAAYILHGPLWGRLILVGMAVPLAMLGNILRVTNLLFVARYWGGEVAFRFYHDYSGLIFFGVVLLLLIPLTRLLQCKAIRFELL